MPGYLDLKSWPRKSVFEFFREFESPHFGGTAFVEVGPTLQLARSAGYSFTQCCIHAALRVVNHLEPFRYRLDGERVLVHDTIHASSTALLHDERMVFTYYDFQSDLKAFLSDAAAARERAAGGRDTGDQPGRDDVIYFSTMPWVTFTSLVHARRLGNKDSIPRITFGRFEQHASGVRIPVSVEVHHALMDGLHVGRFYQELEKALAEPGA
ncbi:MAG: hypothetical protein JJ896_14225 [Rhodothermales bacterium]|nr:hypothetical protein [Rhodothermales bacterium]MBO6780806.1 hypothetical protein [Rhodothermales bacterium]